MANNPAQLREWWSHRRWAEAAHLVSVITGRTEGWGQASTAGCGRLPRPRLQVLGSGKPGSWGCYITSRPNPALWVFLWSVFFLISDLCPSSHISTRWPVRIKIKALGASSCQTICVLLLHLGSVICIMWENLPGTLQEFTPEIKWKGLENRGHHVHDPSNWTASVITFNFKVVLVHLILY